MNPVEFEGQSTVLGPPPGTPQGTVGCLPVAAFAWGMRSFWRPSVEELSILNSGGHVCLDVHGGAHPPVWVSVAHDVRELP